MMPKCLDSHDHSLIHFVTHYITKPGFTLFFHIPETYLIPSSLSLIIVFSRAIFFLVRGISRWFTNCLVARRKRRLKSSWCASSSCFANSSGLRARNSSTFNLHKLLIYRGTADCCRGFPDHKPGLYREFVRSKSYCLFSYFLSNPPHFKQDSP